MPDHQKAEPDGPSHDARPVRRLVLATTAVVILVVLSAAQFGPVQEFVRLRLLAETPEPSLRVVDTYVVSGDTMIVHVTNDGLEPARIDRAEIHVERVWKLRRLRPGPDGGPPPGGWDVPISGARAPYIVGARVSSEVPPDGLDSVRIAMRPEGADYFVQLRTRLVGGGGGVSAETAPLIHFFPGRGGSLPTRVHAEQFERITALGLDPNAPDLALTRARAEAWRENWQRVEEIRALGIRLSPAAREVIERLAWR